ncbi:hypothetical protein RFI_26247 [Reticulomyxa filosa]|uniref:Methyltransferase type 11 domain-containing protein n=1 Tax=Reticulomyxa filosa TaxID=46433 RepID=X6MCF5_RETFI|nr:hypothetical protein RFI_26247 [Reticulomyxa filosa]|eukprot:ETO11127.1 hypothetical protein RFI_26247 [Reticulomyxa filosa]
MLQSIRKNSSLFLASLVFCFVSVTILCWFWISPSLRRDDAKIESLGVFAITNGDDKYWLELMNSIKSAQNQPSDDAKVIMDSKAVEALKNEREKIIKYGGSDKDPEHLGGFVTNDTDTYERELWEWIIGVFNISSIMDVGCGMGYSTQFFKKYLNAKWHGQENVLCVEGSKDAIDQSLVPELSIHHDYAKGPWWPDAIFDMVWSAEFLEHVDEEFMNNYMATFKKAKLILVTHSVWGGWHHTCVHDSPWWIAKFESFGFQYQPELTEMARQHCPMAGDRLKYSYHDVTAQGHRKMSHFQRHGLVFLNRLFLRHFTLFDQMLFQRIAESPSFW